MKKNPLRHRYIRDLKEDAGKYLVIFLLMVLSISEVSGFLVAGESMIAAYNESFEKYHVEDGHFSTERKIRQGTRARIESLSVTLYPLFYAELRLDHVRPESAQAVQADPADAVSAEPEADFSPISLDGTSEVDNTLRIFEKRSDINLECLMDGRFPDEEGEIAVDRLYASNNGYKIGDTLISGQRQWRITGMIALSDYSTMFQNNSDTMFDATQFGVGVVTGPEMDAFSEEEITFCYAFTYNSPPADDNIEREMSEDFLKGLSREVDLTDYIPRCLNQAINFTGEDMGSDRAMMMVLLYIIIAIIAFVFAVTISNTIVKEASVIGTLRASGFTRGELVRHYMAMPVLVTLTASAVGNILGYTVLKYANAWLYYNSYSLPTYETRWNMSAFVETTVIPFVILLVIDWVILTWRLRLSPLKFLRQDLKKGRGGRAIPLPGFIRFFARFRIRVLLQNMPNYLLLFIGILFANLLLMFGLFLPALLEHYEETLPETMLAEYQYILQLPAGAVDEEEKVESAMTMLSFLRAVDTEDTDAEKFSAYSLKTLPDPKLVQDEILLYGLKNESAYVPLRLHTGDVYISTNYAEKRKLSAGDSFTLKEPYEDKEYTFRVTGIFDYRGAMCVFMPQEDLNRIFDLGEGTFTGYFSDRPLTDLDEEYVGQVIDKEALTKVSRQLDKSMGSMMYIVDVFSVIMFMILVYLLTKIIIESNGRSISLAKILGYRNREISALYITTTTIAVIASLLLTLPLCEKILHYLYDVMIAAELAGWIPYYTDPAKYVEMFVIGIVTYAAVAVIEYRKIQKVPLDTALKNVE